MLRPKRTVLGLDFAGVVAALGAGVSKFSQGDRVVDYTVGDFTEIDDHFDFVLDAVGKTSF